MSTPLLDEATAKALDDELPRVDTVRDEALSLSPHFLAAKFDPQSYTPVAAVCFHDCTHTLAETRYALLEYLAHRKYYREIAMPPNPMTAAFFERFYLDDAAYRLYAAGEHLAYAALFMLDVNDDELRPFRKRNRVSEQSVTASYLIEKHPQWSFTQNVVSLGKSGDWQFAMNYRGRLVHDQPPTIAEQGLVYRRQLPWRVSADGKTQFLAIGAGDEAEFETHEIAQKIGRAYEELLGLTDAGLKAYWEILAAHGFHKT